MERKVFDLGGHTSRSVDNKLKSRATPKSPCQPVVS